MTLAEGRRRGRRRGRIVVLALLGLSLLPPADSLALDSDLKGSAVFQLEASHGYSIFGFAASERIDGRGDIGLIVHRGGATVFYAARAIVTPTRLEADLGALGGVSAVIAPSGRKKRVRSRCGDDVHTVEPRTYRGTFEFRGEEGYTEASATEVPERVELLLDLICPGSGGGEVGGPGLPGARLRAFSRRSDRRLSLQLNKNGPGKATLFSATLDETHGRIKIQREISGRLPARTFDYDPLLRTAIVEPSAPFSGAATFRRDATPANRWTGDLSVDFPGASDVSLTGARFSVRVAHARTLR